MVSAATLNNLRLGPLAAAFCVAATCNAHAPSAPVEPTDTIVVQNCDDSGDGSLRAALGSAPGGSTIDLTALSCSTITLTTGALVFGQNDLLIEGPGQQALAIDGGDAGAVLYHLGGGTLKVTDLSIVNGTKYRSDNQMAGACIHAGSNLILDGVNVRNCRASSGGTNSALGGAVFVAGGADIQHSTISHSSTSARGTGISSGGGLYVANGLSMLYSTVADNSAFEGNGAPSYGGGVFARGGALIVGSTISGNEAKQMGGVALVDYNHLPGSIINSTISGNFATVIGGVFSLARLNLYNSTIAFNDSILWQNGGTQHFAAGLHITVSGQMDSTIIANNICSNAPAPTADKTGANGSGFNGGNNNVMYCDSACPTDTTHEDPRLQPLRDNGGPTKTHAPSTSGQWDIFGGTNVLNWQWDQRGPGFPRAPASDRLEIGAFQPYSDVILANGFN